MNLINLLAAGVFFSGDPVMYVLVVLVLVLLVILLMRKV